jgi:hypothetical protein
LRGATIAAGDAVLDPVPVDAEAAIGGAWADKV